jgi:hypothetical protein
LKINCVEEVEGRTLERKWEKKIKERIRRWKQEYGGRK